jgi:hypothetical protein
MAELTVKQMLIVEQVPVLTAPQQACLLQLSTQYGLDPFTTRQKLLGNGLAMIGQGVKEQTEKIADLLGGVALKAFNVAPTRPRFAPERLRSLEITADALILTTQKSEVRIEPGMKVIGILADISGALNDKVSKRLLAHSVYRGTTVSAGLDEAEIRRIIFMHSPVFDLYILGPQGGPVAAVRALPAKFDPTGLGKRVGISSKGNLSALVDLVEEWSNDFSLHTRFGLSSLPGCKIQSPQEGNDWEMNTLRSLVRFGWLMTDLAEQGPRSQPEPAVEGLTPGGVAAGILLGRPDLAAVGATQLPGVKEVAAAIDEAISDEADLKGDDSPDADSGLPLPPYPVKETFSWRPILNYGAAVLIVLFFLVAESGSAMGRWFGIGFQSGVLPGLLGIGCFVGGFNLFLLKRRIENTPTSRIRSLAMGMVEIYGRASRQYALVAPMTQSPCVYYRVRRYRRDSRNNWRQTSDTNSGHVPFLLEDSTGRVTVDPRGASISGGVSQNGAAGQANMLFGLRGESNNNEKWVEETIAEGASLYVLGTASIRKIEAPSLQERKIEKLRELKLDRAALHAYDADGDGRISAEEWQTAREEVEDQVLRASLTHKERAARQEDAIIIGRSPHRNRPFVIAATRSETHLTRKYVVWSGILMAGSLLFSLWGLVAALNYFSLLR